MSPEINPPLYLTVDGVYRGDHLGLSFRDMVTEGVVNPGDLAVTQRGAGANMSVDVAAGACWVKGDESEGQPTYRCRNDATVNLTIATADGSNPRRDRVIAEVLDSAFAGVSNLWRLRVITGTPGGSPSLPAEPNNAVTLAEVAVAASATSITTANITDLRPLAAARRVAIQPRVEKTNGTGTLAPDTPATLSLSPTVDPYAFWSGSESTRWTVPSGLGGLYLIDWMVDFDQASGGWRSALLSVNGNAFRRHNRPGTTGINIDAGGSALLRLVPGDYLTISVNTDGLLGNINITYQAVLLRVGDV